MNWIKENKFLAGFGGFLLVAGGALGALMLNAKGQYETQLVRYNEKARELNTLQTRSLYPNQESFAKIDAQRKEHQQAIMELQKSLSGAVIPIEPMTPVQFQDKLKETVQKVKAKGLEKGTKFTGEEKFYMGFDPYQSEPPRPEAAGPLGRQLKAMELVVMQLIDNHALALDLKRDPLPEESDKSKARNNDKTAKPLVATSSFDVTFTSDQKVFRTVLNNLVASKTQFFIPRRVEVKNQNDKGPSRVDPATAVVVDPNAPPGAPVTPTPPLDSRYIVGEEKVDVSIRLEIVDFPELNTK